MKYSWLLAASLALNLTVVGTSMAQSESQTGAVAPRPAAHLGIARPNAVRQDVFLLGMRFPEYVAGLRRGRLVDYESQRAGLGYSAAYDKGEERATVYVYDLGTSIIPTELISNTVRQQFARAQNDITGNIGPNKYSKVTAVGKYSIADDEGNARYLCASYEIEQDGKQQDSYLCLTSWDDRFVKFRVTMPHAAGSMNEASRFVSQWTETLWPKNQRSQADALRGQRFLTLLYQAKIARKRCAFGMTAQQETKLGEVEGSLRGRTKLTNDQAAALYAAVEQRFDAAEKSACDARSPFAVDYKAVVETMLAP